MDKKPSPTGGFPPTAEQEAVRAAVAAKAGNVMVQAFAGCAKSTTLELAAPGIKVPALSVAFNKKIADESARRMPGNFTCKTMNGLGHGAWLRQLPVGTKIEVDSGKLGKLTTKMVNGKLKLFCSKCGDKGYVMAFKTAQR